jgi:uncharacterized surface protein with fasciclin (FAS1) repeats
MRPLLLLAALLPLAACGGGADAPDTPSPVDSVQSAPAQDAGDTVLGLLSLTPRASDLSAQIASAGLADLLRDTSQTFTLFAPTNEALAAAGPLSADALRGHIVATRLFSGDLEDGLGIETVGGAELTFSTADGGLTIRSASGATARVVEPDLDAGNGVVHLIDAVLTP